MEGFVLLLWFGFCIWVGSAASNKGRSGFFWFLLAFLFSPLVTGVILACVKDLKTEANMKKVKMQQQQLKDRVVLNEKLTEHRLNRVESDVNTLNGVKNGGSISNASQNTNLIGNDTKECPACAETIKTAAIKCKHCGVMLNELVLLDCPFCKEKILKSDVFCKHCNTDIGNLKTEIIE